MASLRTRVHWVAALPTLWLASHTDGAPLINEIDVDQFGTDREEFVEVYNAGPDAIDFDATPHVLVFFNGGDETPPVIDGSYRAVPLTGVLQPGSFMVVGGPDTPNVDLVIDGGGANLIQNGTDAVALYLGVAADWASPRAPTLDNLVDAIVYDTDDEDDPALAAALGVTTQHDEWNGQGGIGAVFSIARDPDGGSFQTGATPTPGASNDADPPLFALADTTALLQDPEEPATVMLRSEGGLGMLQHRVRTLPQHGTLFDDGVAITGTGVTSLPYTVLGELTYLPAAGFDRVDTFDFDAIDGLDRVSEPVVQELAVQTGGVVISEIMHSPGTFQSPQDQRVFEFVEIFNHSVEDVALTRLDGRLNTTTDTTDNLVFEGAPAVIPAWSMRIIAPGGLTPDSDGAFTCEWGLEETDIIRIPFERYENMFTGTRLLLFGAGGVLIDAVNLGPEDFWTPIPGASQSIKEVFLDLFDADLDAAGNDHLVVWPYSGPGNSVGVRLSYSGIALGSPGWVPMNYNEEFTPLPECVPPPIGACCLANGQCAALSAVDCGALTGTYAGDNLPCAQAPVCPTPPAGACCIPAGDCVMTDAYTCGVSAGIYAGDDMVCGDSSCRSQFDIVINEIDYNQAGFDASEYIELHAAAGFPLSGYVVALYNGGREQFGLYRTIELQGSVPGDGYWVIGSPEVPEVDLIAFSVEGIQNGDPDGIALVGPAGEVVDGFAYGGSFVAADGPAAGFVFEDIGVADQAPVDGDPAGEVVLQRLPNGVGAWTVTSDGGLGPDGTPGALNDAPLPAAFGACCLPDGVCLASLEPTSCANAGGVYSGDATSCDVACATLFGACCLPNGECEALLQSDCNSAGGLYFGAGTSCETVPQCDTPNVGACCLVGGACVQEDAFDCQQLAGDYRGDATTCAGQDCGDPVALTINEVYRNDPSLDDLEFVELFGPGGMSLAGVAVVVIEGDHTPLGQEGKIDDVWLLDAFTMPGDGLFVLGDDAVSGVDFPLGAGNQLENGTATFLLIEGFDAFDYPPGTDIDVDNDGLVDPGVDLGVVINGLAIVDGGVDAPEPETDRIYFDVIALGPDGSAAPAGVARIADGLDTGSPADFCALGEAGDGSDGLAIPTPGLSNTCAICPVAGDGNNDGQLDLIDYASLQACFTGPRGPASPAAYPAACRCLDFDADGDIDPIDYIAFHAAAFDGG